MKCPYCNNEMILGIMRGSRESIKWVPKEKDKGVFINTFIKGITVLEWYDSKVEGYYCSECNKITIDLPKKL